MLLLAVLPDADGDPAGWHRLRVSLDCQSEERVEACTYVRGALDAIPLVAVVPRSEAQVDLHLNVSTAADVDFVHLRAVNDPGAGVSGAPESFEQQVGVDYRLTVDQQRALLGPALACTLAPYLSLAVPGSVSVAFSAPEGPAAVVRTSPWGAAVWGGGYGSWSPDYKNLSTWTGASVFRKTNGAMFEAWVNYDRSIELQPSLQVDTESVALTSDSSAILGATTVARHLDEHWSVGGNVRGGHQDPEGQYLATARADVGVEYDLFPSDDPRGNAFAVVWLVGAQGDWYNQANTLGQPRAVFPAQLFLSSATVRVDTVSLSLDLLAASQLSPLFQRYILGASADADLTLGDHVDLSFRVAATQQAIPGPASIDTSSYEAVTRASYAQPLQMDGHLELRLHWDNTNSARNNRFDAVTNLDVTGGL